MPPMLERWSGGEACLVERIGGWRTPTEPVWTLPWRLTMPESSEGGPLATWAAPVLSRITELATLPLVGQVGDRPLDVVDVVDALRFLARVMRGETAAPWIGRLSSGGLQLSWEREDVEVEAVFDHGRGERNVVVVVGDNEWESPVDEADSLFATVVDRLGV